MSKFCTQEHIEAFLQRELTDQEALLLDYVISEVSDTIKTYTGRNWKDLGDDSETPVTTRTYNGSGYNELFIDDFEQITKVEFLDSLGSLYEEISDTDYLLYPSDSSFMSSISLRGRRFPVGKSNIRITGKFTSGPVPDLAVLAATKLAAQQILGSGDDSQTFKKESIEGYSYEMADTPDPEETKEKILSSLDRLKKVSF